MRIFREGTKTGEHNMLLELILVLSSAFLHLASSLPLSVALIMACSGFQRPVDGQVTHVRHAGPIVLR